MAVYLLFKRDEEVLLLRRQNAGCPGEELGLPVGHDAGRERAVSAAIREAKEEVGVHVSEKHLRLVHVMHRSEDGGGLDLFFEASSWTSSRDEDQSSFWAKPERLPTDTPPSIGKALRAIFQGLTYSDSGTAYA